MAGVAITPVLKSLLTPFKVDTAAGGDIAIVAAVAGKKVQVYRALLVGAATATIQFKDGATALTGVMTPATGFPFTLDYTGEPWFESTAGATINLTLAAVQTSGVVYFRQVEA